MDKKKEDTNLIIKWVVIWLNKIIFKIVKRPFRHVFFLNAYFIDSIDW